MTAEQTALTVLFIYAIISSLVVIYVCRDAKKRIRESRVCSHELPKIEEITFPKELYRTLKRRENGTIIIYLHDKPTIKESTAVWRWRMDDGSVSFSTDGGETYQACIRTGKEAEWIREGMIKWGF